MNPELLQLGANFAGIIIVVKMLVDAQKEYIALLIKANDVSTQNVTEVMTALKTEIKELRDTIVDIQIHKG